LLHELTHLVWEDLPARFGLDPLPWWWPLPWLAVAGVVVGSAIRFLPGRGGHPPIGGLAVEPTPLAYLPGVLLAAVAALPLGAVLGPEAPLLALGSGLAVLLARPAGLRSHGEATALVGAAGATAAIAAIFGNPLVGAVLILEAVGLAGPRLVRVLLPCLLASGVGGLLFTGLGDWTGLTVGSLSLPELSGPARPDLPDVLWTVPAAAVIAVAVRQVHRLGRWVAAQAARRPLAAAVGAAMVVGASAAGYALATGRSPAEVALSGQATLAPLATDPHAWSSGALVALLVCKGIGYGVSLGALRGGPVFPALLLGAAAGVLLSGLPGYGVVPALAAGMAAATVSILPLPVSTAVLVILLLGPNAAAVAPVVLVAVVVAVVAGQLAKHPAAPGNGSRPPAKLEP
jgi:H+/Cl- antiporter ClcA